MKGRSLAILIAIESGAHKAHEIAHVAGLPLASTYARLGELKRLGAVRAVRLLKPHIRHPAHPTQQHKHYTLRVWP